MSSPWTLILAGVLFAIGLRLAAFFSGTETGFYRLNFIRLQVQAQNRDWWAHRLLWFAQNPSAFVATTLVGINVAHYIITFAIGLVIARYFQATGIWSEIIATLVTAPFIFVFGDLVPKTLYFRSPQQLLKRDMRWFVLFFHLFRVATYPLVGLMRIVERLFGSEESGVEAAFGPSRLLHVVGQGHDVGLLSDAQHTLVHGVLREGVQSVTESMTPVHRLLGIVETATREEALAYARRYGLANINVRRAGANGVWFAYIRTIDLAVTNKPLASLLHLMPRIANTSNKVDALLALRTANAKHGVVTSGERVVGVVNERGLVEQLFRAPQPLPVKRFHD